MNSEAIMSRKLSHLARQYQSALRKCLSQGARTDSRLAHELGQQALDLGIETLDLARIHESSLITLIMGYSAGARDQLIRQAGAFFAEVITPIENTHRTMRQANIRLGQLNRSLHQRGMDLTASNRELKKEIAHRKRVEEALQSSRRHYAQLLEQSRCLQEQLRHLSRRQLSAQEEERKRISRELHDEIAQTLTGINVQLSALKQEATINVKGLHKKIASAQRMVEKSVNIVHRFARELRPPALDDLGLIPALHSFVKRFADSTGVRVRMMVSAQIEQLDSTRRTVLYRVAHEALTNVAKHARASRVELNIRKIQGMARMIIKDNGKSFSVQQQLQRRGNNHLGLLGMRERVEMVGGHFAVESKKGQGTAILAQIPFRNGKSRGIRT